jgi:hypothetical protein
MKKLMVLFSAVAALFALACVTPADTDTGSSRADAGGTDTRTRTDANAPHDSGGGTWVVNNYGKTCTSNAQCPGGICDGLYDDTAKVCWKKCTTETDCSDFPLELPAGATMFCDSATNGGTDTVCVLGSPQNGPCGDPYNAACVGGTNQYGALCLTDTSGVGFCAQACNVDTPTVNTACGTIDTRVCGCTGGQACGANDVSLTGGYGICAAPTTTGATCGLVNNLWVWCTGDLACTGLSETSPTGTCQTPVTDGGTTG